MNGHGLLSFQVAVYGSVVMVSTISELYSQSKCGVDLLGVSLGAEAIRVARFDAHL